jgi:hypothetical protein
LLIIADRVTDITDPVIKHVIASDRIVAGSSFSVLRCSIASLCTQIAFCFFQ